MQAALSKEADASWTCTHCDCPGEDSGLKKMYFGNLSLCEACGLYYEMNDVLPEHRVHLFKLIQKKVQ